MPISEKYKNKILQPVNRNVKRIIRQLPDIKQLCKKNHHRQNINNIQRQFISRITTIQGIYIGGFPGDMDIIQKLLKTILSEQKLETLDKIRDEILKSPGNAELEMSGTTDADVNSLFSEMRRASLNKLGGLVLKTYDSDIFNNWVKTD